MTEWETTGQAMARALVAHGVDTVFGIPGAHMYDLNDALYGVRDKIRFIHTRHEQGAAYMAYGYAQSTGRIGAFTVVPGPGVLNAGAALCTAYGANAPVLCLTGNIMSHLIGRGRGQLHELPDQLATTRSLTKVAERIHHPAEAGPVMASVIGKMLSGRSRARRRRGAVGRVRRNPVPARRRRSPRPRRRPRSTHAPSKRRPSSIAAAKRPLIMVGGGAVEAGEAVARLAEAIGAPVTAHRSGKGVVSDDHPHALNFVAAYEYWKDADLLIGVGSRLELQYMRWRFVPPGPEGRPHRHRPDRNGAAEARRRDRRRRPRRRRGAVRRRRRAKRGPRGVRLREAQRRRQIPVLFGPAAGRPSRGASGGAAARRLSGRGDLPDGLRRPVRLPGLRSARSM